MADKGASSGEGTSKTWPVFKDKGESLIPAKKKTVKKMMAEYIGQSAASAVNNFLDKKKIKPGSFDVGYNSRSNYCHRVSGRRAGPGPNCSTDDTNPTQKLL
ncbi:unnamed protein product [Ilex paraguariensis]|uniref:Uncharacterized protein n=1 Tax=Ilex paraguariensis TaxID=185542 RepID=A0ABC8RED5_9AQUA